MDYFIAIILALVAIVVMFFIFTSIGNADVTILTSNDETRRGRSRRARHPSKRYKEDVLDRESEALIARELAKNPSAGLNTDTKTMRPSSLETRQRTNMRREHRSAQAQPSEEISARRALIDKEKGYKVVEPKQRVQKEKAPQEEKAPAAAAIDDDMERKLSAFFRNSRKGHKGKFTPDAPQPTGTGGHVEVKHPITTTRGWNEL